MYLERFRTAFYKRSDAVFHCGNKLKAQSRYAFYCQKWWTPQNEHEDLLNNYSIPVISYRDVVWPDYDNPPNPLNDFWRELAHPSWNTHQMVADTMSYTTRQIITNICKNAPQRYFLKEIESDANGCGEVITNYDVENFPHYSKEEGWNYVEERLGKWGWIVIGDVSRKIVFQAKLGEKILHVTHLRSYERFGSANMVVTCKGKSKAKSYEKKLKGHHKLRQSTENTVELKLDECKDSDILVSFENIPKKDRTKFKLIRMTTC